MRDGVSRTDIFASARDVAKAIFTSPVYAENERPAGGGGETMFPDDWKAQLRKLHRGDWEMGVGKKGEAVLTLYKAAVSGVTTAYKIAKRNNKTFVHRNWMRGKDTPSEIRDLLVTAVLPHVPKLPEIPA